MQTHVILIDCPDQPGIIHEATGVWRRYGLNVEDQAEFVDRATKHFFMRTEVSGLLDTAKVVAELKTAIPANANIAIRADSKKNIVIFVGQEPHCVGDLLLRHDCGELKANVLAVLSNHDTLENLVRRFGIPFHHLSDHETTREEHEAALLQHLEHYSPDYLILAKYMRILSGGFVRRFPNRVINIHHSFLPAFVGANPYQQAFERGVKIIGATAHFATEKLDEGPIIAQGVIPAGHSKTISQMVRSGRNVEKVILAEALRLVLEDRVFVHGNRTIIFD
jgi:formyltetrahydrofolate deformylase